MVLGYIRNEAKKFKVFVATKAKLIRENSDVNQWRYIETKKNPADYTSHGLTPSYSKKVKNWISGPEFLWQEESKWPNLEDQVPNIANKDQEIKPKVGIGAIKIEGDVLSNMNRANIQLKEVIASDGICYEIYLRGVENFS